jgi:hypothetical protein
MSNSQIEGFGKFVPGFDFLQNLAKSASQTLPQMPSLSNWVAPTLNLEELEKRIDELKAVHFWLDQNSKALSATIHALEVQKMTLATLKGMNFNMGDVANALKLKAGDPVLTGVQKASDMAPGTAARSAPGASSAAAAKSKTVRKPAKADAAAGSVVDPLQWWGALTQQFQEIATGAMKDVATHSAVGTAKSMASGAAKQAIKPASGMAKAASGSGTRKTARRLARKT